MRSAMALFIVLAALSFNSAAQARPYPGPDVQQLYQHLLERIENIPAFDHHAHPGFSDDPDVDAMAATIPNWSPRREPCSAIPTMISLPNMRNGSSTKKLN